MFWILFQLKQLSNGSFLLCLYFHFCSFRHCDFWSNMFLISAVILQPDMFDHTTRFEAYRRFWTQANFSRNSFSFSPALKPTHWGVEAKTKSLWCFACHHFLAWWWNGLTKDDIDPRLAECQREKKRGAFSATALDCHISCPAVNFRLRDLLFLKCLILSAMINFWELTGSARKVYQACSNFPDTRIFMSLDFLALSLDALVARCWNGRVLPADPVVSLHLGEACVAHNKGHLTLDGFCMRDLF